MRFVFTIDLDQRRDSEIVLTPFSAPEAVPAMQYGREHRRTTTDRGEVNAAFLMGSANHRPQALAMFSAGRETLE